MSIDTYPTHHEARHAQETDGGVLLVNDDSTYSLCFHCGPRDCRCRTMAWVNSLAPSWDEAAPENAARDSRHIPQQQSLL